MARRPLKSLVPAAGRRRVGELLGVRELRERVSSLEQDLARLETQLHESRDEAWERSRTRWRQAEPTPDLTWGAEISGDAFIEKALAYGVFGEGRTVVEIGPGYGRLLSSALGRGVGFGRYIGVDLSEENVRHLRSRFARDDIAFTVGDAEAVQLDGPADSLISSLTFKHMFPSFEKALSNLASQMRPGGVAVFDLIEGERRYFEADGVTYIRWYTRPEVHEIVRRAGLEVEALDEVRHHPEITRLLAVARKPEA